MWEQESDLLFSKSLADSHHGRIVLTDNEWNGASFVLTIPLQPVPEETATRNGEIKTSIPEIIVDPIPEEPGTVDAPFKNYKVLLVEDNSELLDMTEDSLKPYFTIQLFLLFCQMLQSPLRRPAERLCPHPKVALRGFVVILLFR